MSEKKNLPSHRIFAVRNYEKNGEEKASWLEVGVAFQNKLGLSIQFQAMPIDGRCVALPYEEKAPYEANGANGANGANDPAGNAGKAMKAGDKPKGSDKTPAPQL